MTEERRTEAQLVRAATRPGDPAAALAAVAELRRRLDALEAAHVDDAIQQGWTWQRVAAALGLTRQAAHARHARRTRRAPQGLVVAGRAREAVQRARGEAAQLGSTSVETDHLLLGLLLDETSPVRDALAACGIAYETVRARVAPALPRTAAVRSPAVSASVRHVLQQSMREAVSRGDDRLDVEHLLLAILHEPSGRGQQALLASGRSPKAIERRLAGVLARQAPSSDSLS